jgi:ATP:cob(I)alamin adenosyltransferase
MPITTKTGDSGRTGTLAGKRLSKCSPEIELFGAMDGLVAMLGYAAHELGNKELIDIQTEIELIFRKVAKLDDISRSFIKKIEQKIAVKERSLPQIKGFVRPTGKSALVHICRECARNTERKAVCAYGKKGMANITIYLNRLSDYIFLIACEEASKRNEFRLF